MGIQSLNISNPVHLVVLGSAAFSMSATNPTQARSLVEPVSLCQNTNPLQNSFLSQHMDTLKKRINSFKALEGGWDGYGGEPPMQEVINNTLAFIEEIPSPFVHLLQADNLYPTPYGTISVEWNRSENQFISIEIGTSQLAYFYEVTNNSGESLENLEFSEKKYSPAIVAVLKDLYQTELI